MEGPTPVRALLHRRTIVVAGVYFFIIRRPLLITIRSFFFFLLSLLGIFGILITSIRAFFHNDMKKVIALSTARQLSFIIFLIRIGNFDLAFFHLISHGFLKALLFLTRGIVIHNNENLQDLRKLQLPTLGKLFVVGFFLIRRIALMGLPFLGAFFRKHQILL
jgi:NADH:ubiquinone oxidoreductase subunit 5 (subunit L)/multisubunit Na+/H+ antiporter MnhA subunit